jgi:hypothetical protein
MRSSSPRLVDDGIFILLFEIRFRVSLLPLVGAGRAQERVGIGLFPAEAR